MATSPAAPPLEGTLSRRLAGTESSPVRDLLALTERGDGDLISLAGGLPAPETFDVPGLRDAFAHVLAGPDAARALQYSTTEGDPQLRARLAELLSADGIASDAGDVLVTTGSQQALALIVAALLNPGDTVLVEEPTYLAALQCFALADVRAIPIPCDDDGPDPAALTALARREGAKVAYLIPTFQNPTGRTIGHARRLELGRALADAGLWLIEDDPYGALRLDGEPVELLAAQPRVRERALVVRTLSKVLAPGLRVGYLRAPSALRGPLAVAKQAADLHTSTIDQLAAARWLATHDFAAHVRSLADHYRPRRDALLAALAEHLPAGSAWTEPEGGLFVWVTLPQGCDAERLLERAITRGVAFVPGRFFYAGPAPRETLRLSFATASPQQLRASVARLAAALREGRD